MGRHVINLDPFNPISIARAEAEMNRIIKSTSSKIDQFLKELAEIGQRAAQGAYGDGGAVIVTVEPIENGFAINASGDAVVFLEFGAGSAVNGGNRYAEYMPFEVRPGSYSEVHYDPQTGSPRPSYHLDGYWEFGGVHYTEVYPRNGMQNAHDAMMQDMRLLAEKVFGNV